MKERGKRKWEMGRHSDRERGAGGRERVRERNKEEGGRKVGMGVVMGTGVQVVERRREQ